MILKLFKSLIPFSAFVTLYIEAYRRELYSGLIFIPVLFALIYLVIGLFKVIKSKKSDFLSCLLVALLLLLIPVKVYYTYYNILIHFLILGTSAYWFYKTQKKINFEIRIMTLSLIVLNIGLLCTSDTRVFKFIYGKENSYTTNLKTSNFKGQPEYASSGGAMSYVQLQWKVNEVYNYPQAIAISVFYTDRSWIKPDIKYSGIVSLLNHEQTHLNILEATRIEAIDSLKSFWGKSPKEIESILTYFHNQERRTQIVYDSITNHGLFDHYQKQWDEKTMKRLRAK